MASKLAGDQMKDFTLKGVVPIGKELGRGAYGKVFTVKYLGLVCAAKEIHSLLLDGVDQVQKKAIKDSFVRECIHCNTIRHPNIVQFLGVYFSSEQSDLPVMVMELMDASIASFVENNQSKIVLNTKVCYLCLHAYLASMWAWLYHVCAYQVSQTIVVHVILHACIVASISYTLRVCCMSSVGV